VGYETYDVVRVALFTRAPMSKLFDACRLCARNDLPWPLQLDSYLPLGLSCFLDGNSQAKCSSIIVLGRKSYHEDGGSLETS
jgi:hypothetical protein